MKPVCCDTSFLVSLYGQDGHTPAAITYAKGLGQGLTVSPFNVFELENAVRFAAWRKSIPSSQAIQILLNFSIDQNVGRVITASCSLPDIVSEARRLSARYTLTGGFRSFDVLHVAAAIHLKASHFLTFDLGQHRLASSTGLKVGP